MESPPAQYLPGEKRVGEQRSKRSVLPTLIQEREGKSIGGGGVGGLCSSFVVYRDSSISL